MLYYTQVSCSYYYWGGSAPPSIVLGGGQWLPLPSYSYSTVSGLDSGISPVLILISVTWLIFIKYYPELVLQSKLERGCGLERNADTENCGNNSIASLLMPLHHVPTAPIQTILTSPLLAFSINRNLTPDTTVIFIVNSKWSINCK